MSVARYVSELVEMGFQISSVHSSLITLSAQARQNKYQFKFKTHQYWGLDNHLEEPKLFTSTTD